MPSGHNAEGVSDPQSRAEASADHGQWAARRLSLRRKSPCTPHFFNDLSRILEPEDAALLFGLLRLLCKHGVSVFVQAEGKSLSFYRVQKYRMRITSSSMISVSANMVTQ